MTKHIPLNVTQTQRDNLELLAAYLEKLPEDYTEFNMRTYARLNTIGDLYSPRDGHWPGTGCGTAGCAVGHGPAAGILPIIEDSDWEDYAWRVFGSDAWGADPLWDWLFAAQWHKVDNTPQGAAQRIRYTLASGIPMDQYGQLVGLTPLCYQENKND